MSLREDMDGLRELMALMREQGATSVSYRGVIVALGAAPSVPRAAPPPSVAPLAPPVGTVARAIVESVASEPDDDDMSAADQSDVEAYQAWVRGGPAPP